MRDTSGDISNVSAYGKPYAFQIKYSKINDKIW